MNIDHIRNVFLERYREWARAEIDLEVATGLSRLARVTGGAVPVVYDTIREWPLDEQRAFLRTRHSGGVGLTERDAALMERVKYETWMHSPAAEERRNRIGLGDFMSDLKPVRAALKSHLKAVLGPPKSRSGGTTTWRYRTCVDGFTVCTEITTHKATVAYWQILHVGEVDYYPTKETVIFAHTSLPVWLGAGPAEWSYFTRGQISTIAQDIGEWALCFSKAVPNLVAGLLPSTKDGGLWLAPSAFLGWVPFSGAGPRSR